MTRWLHAVAARAAVPVFLVQGSSDGGPGDLDRLRLDPRLDVRDSPRHACVLVVGGSLPASVHRPAALVHDALPHPRATVWWGGDRGEAVALLPCAVEAAVGADPVAAIVEVHRELLAGDLTTEPAVLEETTRSDWRGVGPYGHGGSGMTGGAPYGRPLADREDDLRDGLTLDVLPVAVGPFFPGWPQGLTLRVRLQGDVVQGVEVEPNPYPATAAPDDPFVRAATEPVALAGLELARAARHLRHVAAVLRILGLSALGARALRASTQVAVGSTAGACSLLAILRAVPVERALPAAAVLLAEDARGLGLLARASGLEEDARCDDPAYAAVDFTPVCQAGGDARARWRQRLAEVAQSMALAERAGGRARDPGQPLEPSEPPAAAVLGLLPRLLVGAEWGDAVAVVAGLGLDLRRTAQATAGAVA